MRIYFYFPAILLLYRRRLRLFIFILLLSLFCLIHYLKCQIVIIFNFHYLSNLSQMLCENNWLILPFQCLNLTVHSSKLSLKCPCGQLLRLVINQHHTSSDIAIQIFFQPYITEFTEINLECTHLASLNRSNLDLLAIDLFNLDCFESTG